MKKDTLENRFFFYGEPIIYEIMEDPAYHEDFDGFRCIKIKYRHNFPQILKALRLSAVDAVYTDIQDETFLHLLEEMGIIIYSVHPLENSKMIYRFGRKIWTKGGYEHDPRQEKVKGVLDIIGGIIGCVLTVLLFLTVGPMIKLESKGPILFRQRRVGINGRRFTIWKFRTMGNDAEAKREETMGNETGIRPEQHLMFKKENDPRVTRLGRILRRTSIDEFPQFFNVVAGDMSVVGTRPPMESELILYKPPYKKRLAIKPGVTGIWQTSGRNKVKDFKAVVDLDMIYIKNGSVLQYLSIILKTVLACLKLEGC